MSRWSCNLTGLASPVLVAECDPLKAMLRPTADVQLNEYLFCAGFFIKAGFLLLRPEENKAECLISLACRLKGLDLAKSEVDGEAVQIEPRELR
jgi:hypothetical protein